MTTSSTELNFNDTQQKIIDAAIRCVKQFGIEKTNLNDIAKEAGVTRPTVYSYFPNRRDVIRTALLQSGYHFASRLTCHISQFTGIEDRLIESLIFSLEELPKEPYLALITQTDMSSHINADALNDPEGQTICLELFQTIFQDNMPAIEDLLEITEISTRILLSLLMLEGPLKRSTEEQRAFLKRRLLPCVLISHK